MSNDTTTQPEDRPARGDRGWRGLARSRDEVMAFAGTLALIVLAVLAGLIWGLPGIGVLFLLLTLVTMVVLVVISMGS